MKTVRIISRIVLGIVFIFSGFVKGIDPEGFGIKLSEYLVSFGLPEMETFSMILGILVSAGELIIGVCLFIGLRMAITAWAAFLFMSFFTVLTLYIAIANPVTDCGCFGDAIKLTNWGTFYKNLVLIVPAIIVFVQRKKYLPVFKPTYEWGIIGFYTIFIVSVFVYCVNHLPIIDFRPYHVGADIKAGMIIPEGAPTAKYKTTFLYKKDGVVKEFSESNYPWEDSTWVWVETKQDVIEKGYEPPIHDFSVTTETGLDITDSLLNSSGYTFFLVTADLQKANKEAMIKASALAEEASKRGYGFYSLTASPKETVALYRNANHLKYPFCYMDKTTLKTIIRANPGLVLIKDGIVLGQWHHRDFPDTSYVKGNLMAQQLNNLRKMDNNKMNFLFISVFLLSVAGLVLLKKRMKE